MFFNKEPELYYVVYLIKDKEENPNNEVIIFEYNEHIHGYDEDTFSFTIENSIYDNVIHLKRLDDNVKYKFGIKTKEEAKIVKLQFENTVLKDVVDDLKESVYDIETRLNTILTEKITKKGRK